LRNGFIEIEADPEPSRTKAPIDLPPEVQIETMCLAKGIFFYWDKYYGKSLAERCFNMRIQRQYPFLRRYPKAMWEKVVKYAREHGWDNLPSPREFL